MSLNGLDHAAINEAYGVAAAEAGGWFLLKYVSRDEVELFSQGNGGVTEVRDAVAQYPEQSPLYGFIRYRRRSVLIKYVPTGTSRLLQARLTVHFQSIIDRFSPHDTIFTISTAEELKDSALSSACSLHAASGSTSSSTSSAQRRRLGEIAEDEEEGSTIRAKSESATPTGTPHLSIVAQEPAPSTAVTGKRTTVVRYQKPSDSSGGDESPSTPLDRPMTASALSSPKSDYSSTFGSDTISGALNRHNQDIRFSTNSARPSMGEIYDAYPYSIKPKVKLGPRPSLDPGKRPHTSGSAMTTHNGRPVSTLPPGIRLAPRKPSAAQDRPKTEHSNPTSKLSSAKMPLPPPIPLPLNLSPSTRSSTSPGKLGVQTPVSRPKSSAITPEKQRLMKAMQLRRKRLAEPSQSTLASESESADKAAGSSEESKKAEPPPELGKEIEDTLAKLNGTTNSGSVSKDVENVEPATRKSTSSPVSGTGSTEDLSTKASSISEAADKSTDRAEAATVIAGPREKPLDQSSTPPAPEISVNEAPENLHTPVSNEEIERLDGAELKQDKVAIRVENSGQIDDKSLPPSKGASDAAGGTPNIEAQSDAPKVDTSLSQIDISDRGEKVPQEFDSAPAAEPKKHHDFIDGVQTGVKIEISGDTNDDLSDGSLMDELDTASFHEAQHISVIKTPISPFFPKDESSPELSPVSTRSASDSTRAMTEDLQSNRYSTLTEMPVIETARSVSASHLSTVRAQQSPVAIAKKVNVSSGISQRIKALEMRSASPTTSTATPSGSPSFQNGRANGLNPPSRNGTITGRQSPVGFRSTTPSPSIPQEELRLPKKVERKTNQEKQKAAKAGGTSISVTAHIIREPIPAANTAELKEPPTAIKHNPPVQSPPAAEPEESRKPVNESRASIEKTSSGRSLELSQTSSAANSSRRSSSSRTRSGTTSPPHPNITLTSIPAEDKKEKRSSTTSRILRRMSSISTQSRKSIANAISPAPKEPETAAAAPVKSLQPQAAEMVLKNVEVNVQFPDNLLWKRRCLNLDRAGSITLSPSRADEYTKISTRRFRLSEFASPFAPDQDQQELPFSVVLDHLDGGTLQCACENSEGQKQLLKALRSAHHSLTASS